MFNKAEQARLRAFIDMSHQAGERADYVQGGGGNTSVKLSGNLMAIKASGFCLSDLREDMAYALLDYAAIRDFFMQHEQSDFEDVEKAGAAKVKAAKMQLYALPDLRPSVEAGFHSLLDSFVLHTHSVYANLAACAKEGRDILKTALEGAQYTYGYVHYVDPGSRLTFAVRDEIARVERETGKRPAALIMQNHGLIVHHDDMNACIAIHADVNERIAAAFGVNGSAFPSVALEPMGEGAYLSDTPFLREQLQSGAYSEDFLLRQPLYPDQLVFLNGTLSFGGAPAEGKCTLDEQSGLVRYHMQEKTALVIEETLAAIVFIISTIKKAGYTLSTMGEEAQAFIASWESEQYRKSLSAKKQGGKYEAFGAARA